MRTLKIGSAIALLIASFAGPAIAAPIGITVDASTTVTGSGAGGRRQIRKDSPVFSDDRLRADRTGNAQIILKDDTRIVVGPNARVDIDEFVFDTSTTFKKLSVRATRGAFRFISGRSGSQAYSIETPTGTIGVRGTAFDVAIEPGQTHVTVVRGAVRMCSDSGNCDDIAGWCSYGIMTRSGVDRRGSLRERSVREREKFALMQNESQLTNRFRHLGASCASANLSIPNTPNQIPNAVPNVQPSAPQPAPPSPAPAPGNNNNRSGLGDGTNPGKGHKDGKDKNNQGTNNPGNG